VLGYTNRFGHGIARTIKSLELNGNPPAQFAFDQVSFQVTVVARTDNERNSKKSLDSPG
jgi:predicted HTH transcriptional regulator